jgi:ankyrin repeat protein/Ni2+-binding GTPase involved in maturation of urease and hydrogenase
MLKTMTEKHTDRSPCKGALGIPTEKQAHLSPLEGVQSQDNPTDRYQFHSVKSADASSQQVSLLSAQPERQEEGTEKIVSASEAKTHQAIDGRYLEECSISDKSTWSAVAAKKEHADFKILRITNSQTVSTALDFMQQADFYETFNQASHWFFIVIQVDDCNDSPSDVLECLAKVLDERKPVIIQWDFVDSAKHLVFFKQPGQCAFTQLQMNSDSLFTTEDELIAQLSKGGSFQLPLLLNALKINIGGQFKGDVLDLLGVSFDVKQEIDTWRLIDYAARDDDSLSLWFLLLVDWDLRHQNGDRRRTLEIAAEYGSPQSLSALLNLPVTCSTEEVFLSSKTKELLTLRNDLGDNPLLIAAQKGRPETLQFLIWCGADIHCHRGAENVSAIALAWDKERYENVRVLLEADSPFPENFYLSGLEESESTIALMKEVDYRQSFHQAIAAGSQETVKAFIKSHPQLKQAYDHSNQCALTTALKAGQYEIYALLLSEGFCAGKSEQVSVVTDGLTREQRHRLKEANLKYFRKMDNSHIIYLLSKSRLGFGQENRKDFGIILEIYKQLDAIPEISTILKVVEQSEGTEIIFDFNRDSIIDLDPTQSSATKGACDYREGRIYVGAKEQTELLGPLAHELTHLAMQVYYNNDCNPYEVRDEQKKHAFDKIVGQYCDKRGIDPIIERVFSLYRESDWPAELIARVPHLLAHYSGEQDKQLLTQQAPELFHFYEQETQEDLRNFIANAAAVKARHQIRHVNDLLGKLGEIEQSRIWLNDECLLENDIINCLTIQILSTSLPRLTILNLYQVLRRKQLSISDIKSGYIFVSAEQFESQRNAETIYRAFQSVAHPTLIIDCSCEYHKNDRNIWSTVNSFSEKRIIFIAVTGAAQSIECKLKEYQEKIVHDREYSWSDLTPDSQKELLENTVCFQGSRMSLSQLISVDSLLTKFLPLDALLEDKTLEIGKPMQTFASAGCIENCYVHRTFNHQVAIKEDIFEQRFSDLLTTTEEEFKKCCQDNPKRNVHWLLKDKSGTLIWQKSQGSLKALHKYIDTRNPRVYPADNLEKFLQQAQCQKVMLIADTAGMGKTTVLTHLAKQIKQKYPTCWVVRIDLNDHTDVLEDQVEQKMGTVEFMSGRLLNLHSPLEKELFKHCLQGLEGKTKVVLMFDSFDEISPHYKETVLDLLQGVNPLKQPGIEQLWVTTRLHLRGVLEDHLQQLCYTLEPFSKHDQVRFLTKFWHHNLKYQEGSQKRLEIYATALIEKLAQSIGDKEEFTGIPLQARMLAEVFRKEVESFCFSGKSEPVLPEQLNLVDLYRKFIKSYLNVFLGKGEIAKEQCCDSEINDVSIPKNHQKLALDIMFPELEDTVLKFEESSLLSSEAIARIGIVQYVSDKPHFIHHTFAEYYVADFLVTQLTKKNNFLSEVQDSLLNKILLEGDHRVIRFFLDGLLLSSVPSEANLKQYGKQIYNEWKIKQNQLTRVELTSVLHQAAQEGNAHIIGFLFNSLRAADHSDTINNLLRAGDRNGQTACHLAAKSGHTRTLQKLWGWAREVQLNLKDDMLLAKDKDGQTAWHIAAWRGYKQILENLWGWAREVQVNLKDDLLLAKDKDGQNAWQIAIQRGYKEILEKFWGWGRDVPLNLKDDLLIAKDKYGQTAWHLAAKSCHKNTLEKLWGFAREVKLNLKDDLLLAKDKCGQTAWHLAAKSGHINTLEKLWVWVREVQLNLKDDVLLAKDKYGQTAWHLAVRRGYKEILEKLWVWAREVQLNLKDDLLLAKDKYRQTAWNIAARCGYKEILKKLWGWAREMQLNLKDDFLLAKDKDRQTACQVAVQRGYKEILETLRSWAREVQVDPDDDVLLAKNTNELTAWPIVAEDFSRKK